MVTRSSMALLEYAVIFILLDPEYIIGYRSASQDSYHDRNPRQKELNR